MCNKEGCKCCSGCDDDCCKPKCAKKGCKCAKHCECGACDCKPCNCGE